MKVGGRVAANKDCLDALVEDQSLHQHVGIRVVLVHGRGDQATANTLRLGLDQEIVAGRRVTDLQTRAASLQRKAQQRDREVSATEQKAVSRLGQELDPLVRQAYQQKHCSLLLQRSAVVFANPAMDLTPQVGAALNAKITQFAFDRERLDQAAPAAAAAPKR